MYVSGLLLVGSVVMGQAIPPGLAINTTGSDGDTSAFVDIDPTPLAKGLLIPRLTTAQRNSIANPGEGLLLYNKDCKSFQYWDGACWRDLTSGNCVGPSPNCALVGWQYFRAITIQNPNNQSVSNYQVKIIINTQVLIAQGKMKSAGEDMRFTDKSCNLLPYWIESGINTPSTIVWVKISSLCALATDTIYMWYGNAGAVSAENPAQVFDFWEDFVGNSTGQFTPYTGASYTFPTASTIRVNAGQLYLTNQLPFSLNNGYFLEAKVLYHPVGTGNNNYSGNLQANSSQLGGCGYNTCSEAVIHYMRRGNTQNVHIWTGNGGAASYNIVDGDVVNPCWGSTDNTWYVISEKIMPNKVEFYRDYSLQCQTSTFSWAKNLRWIMIGNFDEGSNNNIQDTEYDWVRVRKALPTDPIVTIYSENGC